MNEKKTSKLPFLRRKMFLVIIISCDFRGIKCEFRGTKRDFRGTNRDFRGTARSVIFGE